MTMYCVRHPKVQTSLACGRCGAPICTECAVSGAVGMLCQKCAYGDGNPLYKVPPMRMALTVGAGLLAGVGVGFLLQAMSGMFFLLFLLCPIIGGFLGQTILWASGFKRGRTLEILAGTSVVGGSLIALLLNGAVFFYLQSPLALALFALGVALTAGAAIGKIRYF
ncbi:MAG: B-box zinc finger protein [Capsulimonadales bacterium]|nr:B-box zinc finger protein [Capsulimonadales bacterium]